MPSAPSAALLNAAIEAKTATMEPAMVRAYLLAIKTIQGHMEDAALIRRVMSGAPLDLIISAKILDQAYGPMTKVIQKTVGVAWEASIAQLPISVAAQGGFTFNVLSPYVRQAMTVLDAELLKPLKAEVRETVRQAIAAGLESGRSPIEVARGLREVIGLAPNQEQYVRNLRNALYNGDWARVKRYTLIDKRFTYGPGMSPEKIEKFVAAYRRRFLASHAETITRTATLNAYRRGQRAAVEDAIAAGEMGPRQGVTKTWVTVGDSRVREAHVNLNGETLQIDQEFLTQDGVSLDMPNEYRCRCKLRYSRRVLSYGRFTRGSI